MDLFRKLLTAVCAAVVAMPMSADVMWSEHRDRWMNIAEESKPCLHETVVKPLAVVEAVNDTTAYQHWRYDSIGYPDDMLY